MTIKWHPPLDKLFGSTTELELREPVSVRRLLRLLVDREPRFQVYARSDPDESRPRALLVWRRGAVMKLDELVEPRDEIEMLVLVTGG